MATNGDDTNVGFHQHGPFATIAKALSEAKINLSSISNLKPSFRLSPPKGGFRKSTRRMYAQGGTLGYNPDLPKLISNMI